MPLGTAEFVFALVLATVLSLLVFRHAERHGNRRATAWGVATFFFGLLRAVLPAAALTRQRRAGSGVKRVPVSKTSIPSRRFRKPTIAYVSGVAAVS